MAKARTFRKKKQKSKTDTSFFGETWQAFRRRQIIETKNAANRAVHAALGYLGELQQKRVKPNNSVIRVYGTRVSNSKDPFWIYTVPKLWQYARAFGRGRDRVSEKWAKNIIEICKPIIELGRKKQ